jgi:hypothetical protein
MVTPSAESADRAAQAPATAPPFPDCWVAYGATNAELGGYGPDLRLASSRGWLLGGARVALAAALAALALGGAPVAVRWGGAVLLCAVLCSAGVALVRLLAAPSRLLLRRERLALEFPFGRRLDLAWESIAEIGLVGSPGRLAVGLRLRPDQQPRRGPAGWFGAVHRRLSSGFDVLLAPADGDCELLGRALLRYCIDPQARRRLLPSAVE